MCNMLPHSSIRCDRTSPWWCGVFIIFTQSRVIWEHFSMKTSVKSILRGNCNNDSYGSMEHTMSVIKIWEMVLCYGGREDKVCIEWKKYVVFLITICFCSCLYFPYLIPDPFSHSNGQWRSCPDYSGKVAQNETPMFLSILGDRAQPLSNVGELSRSSPVCDIFIVSG